MIAVTSPLSTPSSTARSTVRANICRSASCSTSRARNELNVVAPIPATSSPTPSAARQSRSTLLRRADSTSLVLSWVASSNARTITEGGIDGRPLPGA
jgi:hypothetical protein